jgi:RNA polymerase primary sigma factor
MTETNYSDPVQAYLREAESVPGLSREEEIELAKKAESAELNGSEDAKRKLIEAHLTLAAKIAFEYEGRGVPVLNLIEAANLGLMLAVNTFDYRLQDNLAAFAAPLIRTRIIAALTETSS